MGVSEGKERKKNKRNIWKSNNWELAQINMAPNHTSKKPKERKTE